MPETRAPAVRAIPPLSTIQDRAVRDVLEALVDGWSTRNGQKGDEAEHFVRKGDIAKMAVDAVRYALVSGGGSGGIQFGDPGVGGQTLGQIIAGLTGAITESMLFRALGDRINAIDKPGGLLSRVNEYGSVIATLQEETAQSLTVQTLLGKAVGDLEAGLATETAFRVSDATALAEAVNTMWSAVSGSVALVQDGGLTKANDFAALASKWSQLQAEVFGGQGVPSLRVALAQEASVRANRDGSLEAQYTVKIDNNGYVSGFGLASTARNSTPVSKFVVRADAFAIGSPVGPASLDPVVPFTVLTTSTVIDGVEVPVGVYITDAFIQNASIDTLKIRGQAITETLVASGGTTVTQSITLPDSAAGVLAISMATISNSLGGQGSFNITLDGLANGISLADGYSGFIAGAKFIAGGGTKSISSVLSGTRSFTVQQHNLILMGAKR